MFTFLLAVALIVCWRSIVTLRRRVDELEAQSRLDQSAVFADLVQRLSRLEAGVRQRGSQPEPRPPSAPVVAQPAAEPEAPRSPAVASPVATPMPPPAIARPVSDGPAGDGRIASAERREPRPHVAPAEIPLPAPAPATMAAALPAPVARADSPAAGSDATSDTDAWEVVVGTSWLNKIGVLVFVIGVALLVGYSFTHIGPAGRVAIGFTLSVSMLAGGVALERQDRYRTYAYGLIAGGWAGVYFTTFASHAIPAARIVESELVAAASLFAVACGMIGHSLRYRSQTVTGLSYVVAYATLALAPLTAFALVASVPLALSILVVATRLGWPRVAVLGVAATYGVFVLRVANVPIATAASTTWPLATVALYWLVFEAADIIGARGPWAGQRRTLSLFPLNAVGVVGASLLLLPVDDAGAVATFTAVASGAYLASALVRARLLPAVESRLPEAGAFGTMHAAVAMAAGLAIWSIELRFSGSAQTLALLTEAELLFASGLVLGERQIRTIGGAALLIAVAHGAAGMVTPLLAKALLESGVDTGRTAGAATPVAVLAAFACIANREVLRSRGQAATRLEQSYTWMAFVLTALAVAYEVPFAYWALASTLLGLALLEAGLRRATVYRYQAYVAVVGAVIVVIGGYFVLPGVGLFDHGAQPAIARAIPVLALVAAIACGAAYRLRRAEPSALGGDLQFGVAAFGLLGAIALTLLPWHLLPPVGVAPAWALLACGAMAIGARYRQGGSRGYGYALIVLAALRSIVPLSYAAPQSLTETIAAGIVIAGLFVIGYVGRRAAPVGAAENEHVEWQLATTLGFVATAAFALFKWRVLAPIAVAPGWAATAAVLVLLGVLRDRAGQRWQGYLLAAIGGIRALTWLAEESATPLDYWSPLSVCALGYTIAALGRGAFGLRRAVTAPIAEPEKAALRLLPLGATFLLVAVETDAFAPEMVGPIWALTATGLLLLGLRSAAGDLRWQSYVLLLAAASRTAGLILPQESSSAAALVAAGLVIGLMYAMSLAGRRALQPAEEENASGIEDALRLTTSVAATILLGVLILNEARPTVVTLGWGLEGLALMVSGFVARERVLRLSGLGVLLMCILKLFLADLRGLEPLARIMSFVVLGLVLLAVSWTYTRYQEQIRKYL